MKKSIGFVGGGRITRIFLEAFGPEQDEISNIVVAEISDDVSRRLKEEFPFIKIGSLPEVASREIVFISLHPPVIMDTLDLMKDHVRNDAAVISLAPKITLGKIASKLLAINNIARMIPNATSFIHEGFNPIIFSENFSPDLEKEVLSLLRILGFTFKVPETKLESYAILSAMLPTYFWFQWNELIKIGTQIGLSEDEARIALHQTLHSALNLMFGSGLTPSEVMDLVPVKPMSEHEAQITQFYEEKLISLFEKIKP